MSLFSRCVSVALASAIVLVSDHAPTVILAVAILALYIFSPQVRP